MNIWSLDLGVQVGVAMGHPPADLAQLNSMTLDLRTHAPLADLDEDCMRLALNLEAALAGPLAWKSDWPDLIVFEAPHDPHYNPAIHKPGGVDARPRNSMSMVLPWILACKMREIAYVRGIACRKVYPNSIRPVFIGSTGRGNRDETKKTVIRRCKDYGYLPEHLSEKTKKNTDRADAIALWHYAQVKFARWQPPVEFVMNQKLVIAGA